MKAVVAFFALAVLLSGCMTFTGSTLVLDISPKISLLP